MLNKTEIPFEYQKGFVQFLNCKINLQKGIFIPRIETEFWVKKAIRKIKDLRFKVQGLKVLDMFAGSGCIGIAILKACPELCQRVDFVDIDKKAIEQIKINLELNQISSKRYRIYKSDLFKKLKKEKFDFIFTNPPYVAIERLKEVEPSVLRYERKGAILAGKGGLVYIRKFLKEAKEFLKKKGVIYLEFDPQQKKEVQKILQKNQYSKFKFLKDQFKKYRWLKIQN